MRRRRWRINVWCGRRREAVGGMGRQGRKREWMEKVGVWRREQAGGEPHPRMSDASGQKATRACRDDVGE